MLKQNTRFSSVLNDSAHASEELARTISGMVVGMQFQDRTTQYIENSVNLLSDMQESIEKLKNDSSGVMPELLGVSTDKELASHIFRQFKLSEFAQMFNDSLEGKPLNTTNGHAKNDAVGVATDDNVELF